MRLIQIENERLVKEIESMRETLKNVENDKNSFAKQSEEQQSSIEELKTEVGDALCSLCSPEHMLEAS
jgi:predicted  nucleic acid-binding Zn-ribbon protein